jgi:oligoendopeptidase F
VIEKESTYLAKDMVWNLDELYRGDEPELDGDLRAVRKKAQTFVVAYKGKLDEKNLNAQTLLSAMEEYEAIHDMGMKPYAYAYLYRSSNVLDHRGSRLFHKVMEEWNEISQMLIFFLLEITALPEGFLKRLAGQNTLSAYRHFLFHQIQRKPHILSEPQEKIIHSKDLSGKKSFVSLYDEHMGSLSFPLEVEGNRRSLTSEQVLSLLHSPDRSVRENAFQAFLQELGRHSRVFKHILNALTLDHHLEDLERGHPSPMHRIHLSNGVEGTTIETMMEAVEGHYPLAQEYFRLKARLLGLGKMKNTDLLAPLEKEGIRVKFSVAKQLTLETLEDLHPLFHSMGREFFEKNWIDAEVRVGKKGGAFCKCFAPSQHPFVSINYTGHLRDLAILAHELGHGIHYRLAAKQSYLNFDPSPIFAETASTFTEILLIQHLMKKKDVQIPLSALLSSHMEGILITVYRQNVLSRFEQAIHRLRQDHLLGEEEICQLWWDENYRLYGEDVEMIPDYRWGWTYIPHFIHRPFYCYSYIFGNLLSAILYQNYRDKGGDFLEKIILLFSAGCSQAPLEMLAELGLDPGKKSFWAQAFQYVEGLIDALEMLEQRQGC